MRCVAALAGLVSATSPAFAENPQRLEPLFLERFGSFKALGYDPLTTPVEWYRPTETVRGIGNVPRAETALPAPERRISSAALKAAAAFAEQQASIALLVYYDGRLEYERYWQGTGRDSYFNPQSMSKSLLGLMIGIAIRDGHIKSVDDRVDTYVSEWRDDPRGAITLRHLLQMSGGLAQISDSYEISLDNPAVYHHFGTDFVGPILDLPLADPPGAKWDYNNNETNLLGIVLERASGKRYADYLSEALWQPLGLANAKLYLDRPGGVPMFSCCVLSRPIDWLMLGVMFMQHGEANGRQIVPGAWIREMMEPSPNYAGYGYQVWVGDHVVAAEPPVDAYVNQPYASEPFLDPKAVSFRGFGYQRVWIMPSKRLVVVRAGREWPAAWDNAVIPNTIFRGTP